MPNLCSVDIYTGAIMNVGFDRLHALALPITRSQQTSF